MIDKKSIFILIRFKNGCYSDWIETTKSILDSLEYQLKYDKYPFLSIIDRGIDYPYIVKISEIQSIEVDVPTEEELNSDK